MFLAFFDRTCFIYLCELTTVKISFLQPHSPSTSNIMMDAVGISLPYVLTRTPVWWTYQIQEWSSWNVEVRRVITYYDKHYDYQVFSLVSFCIIGFCSYITRTIRIWITITIVVQACSVLHSCQFYKRYSIHWFITTDPIIVPYVKW
jgi:hypothetical protein